MADVLDFNLSKTNVLTLDELRRTQHEDFANGEPVGGIYHHALIEQLLNMMVSAHYHPSEVKITACDNQDKYRPGVTLNHKLEDKYGLQALEAYTLRRIIAEVDLTDFTTEEHTMRFVVSYHQKGIQIGFGPNARVCQNMMVMGAQYVISNMSWGGRSVGKRNSVTIDKMLESAAKIIMESAEHVEHFGHLIERLKNEKFSRDMQNDLIVELYRQRLCYDLPDSSVHDGLLYSLNQTQLNAAVFRYLLKTAKDGYDMSAYDAYQIFNFGLKPAMV